MSQLNGNLPRQPHGRLSVWREISILWLTVGKGDVVSLMHRVCFWCALLREGGEVAQYVNSNHHESDVRVINTPAGVYINTCKQVCNSACNQLRVSRRHRHRLELRAILNPDHTRCVIPAPRSLSVSPSPTVDRSTHRVPYEQNTKWFATARNKPTGLRETSAPTKPDSRVDWLIMKR